MMFQTKEQRRSISVINNSEGNNQQKESFLSIDFKNKLLKTKQQSKTQSTQSIFQPISTLNNQQQQTQLKNQHQSGQKRSPFTYPNSNLKNNSNNGIPKQTTQLAKVNLENIDPNTMLFMRNNNIIVPEIQKPIVKFTLLSENLTASNQQQIDGYKSNQVVTLCTQLSHEQSQQHNQNVQNIGNQLDITNDIDKSTTVNNDKDQSLSSQSQSQDVISQSSSQSPMRQTQNGEQKEKFNKVSSKEEKLRELLDDQIEINESVTMENMELIDQQRQLLRLLQDKDRQLGKNNNQCNNNIANNNSKKEETLVLLHEAEVQTIITEMIDQSTQNNIILKVDQREQAVQCLTPLHSVISSLYTLLNRKQKSLMRYSLFQLVTHNANLLSELKNKQIGRLSCQAVVQGLDMLQRIFRCIKTKQSAFQKIQYMLSQCKLKQEAIQNIQNVTKVQRNRHFCMILKRLQDERSIKFRAMAFMQIYKNFANRVLSAMNNTMEGQLQQRIIISRKLPAQQICLLLQKIEQKQTIFKNHNKILIRYHQHLAFESIKRSADRHKIQFMQMQSDRISIVSRVFLLQVALANLFQRHSIKMRSMAFKRIALNSNSYKFNAFTQKCFVQFRLIQFGQMLGRNAMGKKLVGIGQIFKYSQFIACQKQIQNAKKEKSQENQLFSKQFMSKLKSECNAGITNISNRLDNLDNQQNDDQTQLFLEDFYQQSNLSTSIVSSIFQTSQILQQPSLTPNKRINKKDQNIAIQNRKNNNKKSIKNRFINKPVVHWQSFSKKNQLKQHNQSDSKTIVICHSKLLKTVKMLKERALMQDESQKSQLDQVMEALQTKIKFFENQMSLKNSQIESMQEKELQFSKELTQQKKQHRLQVESSQNFEQQNKALLQSIKEYESNVAKMKSIVSDLADQNNQKDNEAQKFRAMQSQMKIQIEEHMLNTEKYNSAIQKYKADAKKQKKDRNMLKERVQTLQLENASLTTQMNELQKGTTRMEDIHAKLEEVRQSKDKLQQQNAQLAHETIQLTHQKAQLQQQVVSMQEGQNRLNSQIESLQGQLLEHQSLVREAGRFEDDKSTLQKELNNTRLVIQQMSQKANQNEAQFKSIIQQTICERDALKLQHESVQQEQVSLRQSVATLNKEKIDLMRQLTVLNDCKGELEGQVGQMREIGEEQNREIQLHLKQLDLQMKVIKSMEAKQKQAIVSHHNGNANPSHSPFRNN